MGFVSIHESQQLMELYAKLKIEIDRLKQDIKDSF